MSHRSITVPATIAVVVALAPAGALASQDLRSPDARDAGRPAPAPVQDLRSPDTRDVAAHRAIPPARVVSVSSDGFDWGDAAIGAGGAAGLVLVLAGAGTALTRRRVTHTLSG
jgi:hypothetical protein